MNESVNTTAYRSSVSNSGVNASVAMEKIQIPLEVAWSYMEILKLELATVMPKLHAKMKEAEKEFKENGLKQDYDKVQDECFNEFQNTNSKVLKYLKIS